MNEVLLDLVVPWRLLVSKISLKVSVAPDFLFLLVRSSVRYQDIWISKKLRLNLYFMSYEVFVTTLFNRIKIADICFIKLLHWILTLQG